MEVLDPRDFLAAGVFREADFRGAVERFDWSRYQGKPVIVQGCNSIPIPTWAFLILATRLVPVAKSVSYGELSRPIPVYGKLGASA
jgi:hypothetical protein